jgi:hypothetical protein
LGAPMLPRNQLLELEAREEALHCRSIELKSRQRQLGAREAELEASIRK